jgi:hypothetical protein
MLAADRAILEHPPIEERARQHPNRLEPWLHQTRQIVQLSIKAATDEIRRTTTKLTKFFRLKRKKKQAVPGTGNQETEDPD